MDNLLLLNLINPLICSVVLYFFDKKENLRETIHIIFAICNFIISLYLLYFYALGGYTEIFFFKSTTLLEIGIYTERLGLYFALLVNFLWIISIIYSIGYMRKHHETHQTRFFSFFSVSIFATLGVAYSINLISTFLFYEILTLATYPLVAHNLSKKNAYSVYTYSAVLAITSIALFLTAIVCIYNIGGSLEYVNGGSLQSVVGLNSYLVIFILLLFLFGVAKTGIMPVHKWLPAAMVAPTPVSALLHAVAVVKSGAFVIVKIITFTFGYDYLNTIIYYSMGINWLVVIPSITIIVASCIALLQDNIKKRLAYSTISQLSYIVMAAFIFTQAGIKGAELHIFAHAFGKITLFFAAGAIIVLSHKSNISEIGGLAKHMPIAAIALTVGSLSMIGIPLTFGFISKWQIIIAIIEQYNFVLLTVIIISTILNSVYLMQMVYVMIFGSPKPGSEYHDVGKSIHMDIAMSITSFMVVFLGIVLLFFNF